MPDEWLFNCALHSVGTVEIEKIHFFKIFSIKFIIFVFLRDLGTIFEIFEKIQF